MKRNPRFGPQPGERVRVRNVPSGYPLCDGLKEGDIVLLKSWEGASYLAEFEGREVRIVSQQIIEPMMLTDGRMCCPECGGQLQVRREILECRGCAFRCLKASREQWRNPEIEPPFGIRRMKQIVAP